MPDEHRRAPCSVDGVDPGPCLAVPAGPFSESAERHGVGGPTHVVWCLFACIASCAHDQLCCQRIPAIHPVLMQMNADMHTRFSLEPHSTLYLYAHVNASRYIQLYCGAAASQISPPRRGIRTGAGDVRADKADWVTDTWTCGHSVACIRHHVHRDRRGGWETRPATSLELERYTRDDPGRGGPEELQAVIASCISD